MFQIEESTPLAALTVGQFKELLRENTPRTEVVNSDSKYVYGLKGIEDLFNVCHSTAYKLKDGILAPAVSQNGRKLLIDRELAIKLFSENNREFGKKK